MIGLSLGERGGGRVGQGEMRSCRGFGRLLSGAAWVDYGGVEGKKGQKREIFRS